MSVPVFDTFAGQCEVLFEQSVSLPEPVKSTWQSSAGSAQARLGCAPVLLLLLLLCIQPAPGTQP